MSSISKVLTANKQHSEKKEKGVWPEPSPEILINAPGCHQNFKLSQGWSWKDILNAFSFPFLQKQDTECITEKLVVLKQKKTETNKKKTTKKPSWVSYDEAPSLVNVSFPQRTSDIHPESTACFKRQAFDKGAKARNILFRDDSPRTELTVLKAKPTHISKPSAFSPSLRYKSQ